MEQLYIQQKYLSFLGPQLERFKRSGNLLWNFRCPYCGDSSKNHSRARGYIYKDKKSGLLSFQCHNCGENHHFKTFLKFINGRLFKEYLFETFKDNRQQTTPLIEEKKEVEECKEWTKWLTPVSELSRIHPAIEYLKNRKIPKDKFSKFWYTSNFRDFCSKLGLDQIVPEDPRLILVETDRFGNLKIMIARAIRQSELRYVTLKIDEDYPKVFGLSDIDFTKPIHVVEGAIDSLFIDNCIATLDSNLLGYQKYDLGIKNAVHIWDNEPRNSDVCRYLKNAIKRNESVVIFPETIVEKDINKMVECGIDVKSVISDRTFSGIRAMLEFTKWVRTNTNARKPFVEASRSQRTWVK